MKYRKKPVVIEAIQWTGKNLREVMEFTGDSLSIDRASTEGFGENAVKSSSEELSMKTLEGVMNVSVWDYIIKGVKGEFYPCKPDIFEETYEDEEAASDTQIDEGDSDIIWGDKKLTIVAKDANESRINIQTDANGFNNFEILGILDMAKQQFLKNTQQ